MLPSLIVGVRRAGSSTPDAALAELRAALRAKLPTGPDVDRRQAPRTQTVVLAALTFGDLQITGSIANVSGGGLFLRSPLLVEVGERGTITLGAHVALVRVAWLRGASHAEGPGMGLTFEHADARDERAAIELVLAALEG